MTWEIWLLVVLGLIVIWLAAVTVPSAVRYLKMKRM